MKLLKIKTEKASTLKFFIFLIKNFELRTTHLNALKKYLTDIMVAGYHQRCEGNYPLWCFKCFVVLCLSCSFNFFFKIFILGIGFFSGTNSSM